MNEMLAGLGLAEILTPERLLGLARALITLVVGVLVARFISAAVGRLGEKRASRQEVMLARRLVYYVLIGLVLATALHQLGFQLGVLLGAAGILTVAIGFASQTSASNLISGLFLIAERPFVVGDLITVEGLTGEVLSIDMLSVKLRTFDNLFVRVPNEQIIKSTVTTLTRFPIRRADLQVGVAYKEDLRKVKEVLFAVADRNPLSLDEPKPLLIFKGFGDSAIQFQFSVWAKRENFLELKNTMQEGIKAAFDESGIEIPFPHRTLYAGSATGPLPVQVVQRNGTSG
jgi:small-conductance mechanosensitive channel